MSKTAGQAGGLIPVVFNIEFRLNHMPGYETTFLCLVFRLYRNSLGIHSFRKRQVSAAVCAKPFDLRRDLVEDDKQDGNATGQVQTSMNIAKGSEDVGADILREGLYNSVTTGDDRDGLDGA